MSEFEQRRFLQRSSVGASQADDHEPAGFGLRICKEFVDRMGGRFWIESEGGRGTCFSFRLPYDANQGRSSAS